MEPEEQEELVAKEAKCLWRSRGFKIVVLAVIILLIAIMIHVVRLSYHKIVCRINLGYGLHNSFMVYGNDFDDKLPMPDAWNDLIMEYADVGETAFHCPGSKSTGKMSDYSLNDNLSINACSTPGKAVFLFESVSGWNQSGSSDIFTFDNHSGEASYNTLSYPDGYFIKPSDLDNLKWKPDQIESPLP